MGSVEQVGGVLWLLLDDIVVFVHDGLDKPLPWLCPGSQRYEFRKSCYSNISLANVLSKRELCINQKLSD